MNNVNGLNNNNGKGFYIFMFILISLMGLFIFVNTFDFKQYSKEFAIFFLFLGATIYSFFKVTPRDIVRNQRNIERNTREIAYELKKSTENKISNLDETKLGSKELEELREIKELLKQNLQNKN